MISYLNIKKNEYRPTVYGFLYSFLIVSFFILSKSFRDSLFLNNFTKEDLSYLYLITPIITGFLVWFFLLLLNRFSLTIKSILVHIFICIIASFLLLNQTQNSIFLYYIFVEFQISIIAILFWDVLSESFTNRQAKRLFVIITSGGFLSALIVGSSLSYVSQWIPQDKFVLGFNFLIILCPGLIYLLIKSSFKKNEINVQSNNTEVLLKDIFKNKYILNIIFITFIFSIISVIIDYNFKILSFDKFQDNPLELTNYFARFYSITSFISFVMQLTLSGFIINRFGIKYALMILPVLLFLFFFLGYFIAPFIIVLILKGKEQIFKSTLHDTSMHILWMPIPSFKRITIKPLINILLKNIFSSLSAGLLILSVYFNYTFIDFIPIAAILLIILIFLTRRTKDFYVKELIKAIDDRTLSMDDVSGFIADDSEMLKIIKSKLIKENKNRYFILSLLDKTILEKCKDIMGEIFFDSDSKTQKIILKYLVNDDEIISSDYLKEQINNDSKIALESLDTLCKRNVDDIEKINEDLFHIENESLKFSAYNNSIKYDYKLKEEARNLIKKSLRTASSLSSLIKYTSSSSYIFSKHEIIDLVKIIDYDDFLESLKFISLNNCDREVLDILFERLPQGYYLNENVKKMFVNISNNDLYNFIEYKFLDNSISDKVKKLIIDIIYYVDDEKYIAIYKKYINLTNFNYEILEKVINNLILYKKKNSKYFKDNSISNNLIEKLFYIQYHDINLLYQLKKTKESNKLITEFYNNKIEDISRILMKLIYFFDESLFGKNLQLSIFEKKIYRSKVIEVFEESLNIDMKNKIIPLIDSIKLSEKNNIGLKHYENLGNINLDNNFLEKKMHQDPWYDFIILTKLYLEDNKIIDSSQLLNNRYFKLIFNNLNFKEEDILNEFNEKSVINNMISNLEKTLYLKDSNIFEGIPAKELIYIANVLKEVNLSDEKIIFNDGDIGDSMYFIVKGNIKILKGDIELVTLKKSDYFGEMALLDGESRSADAVTCSDSILLRLDANDFDKIMYSNDKIVKGILSMLSNRLRKANELLNRSK